jgi:hypothetical protein
MLRVDLTKTKSPQINLKRYIVDRHQGCHHDLSTQNSLIRRNGLLILDLNVNFFTVELFGSRLGLASFDVVNLLNLQNLFNHEYYNYP